MRQAVPVDIYVLARIAYDTYMHAIGRQDSNRFPFDDLPPQIKEAWRRAVVAVMAEQGR